MRRMRVVYSDMRRMRGFYSDMRRMRGFYSDMRMEGVYSVMIMTTIISK
jgi:hypothetical protein